MPQNGQPHSKADELLECVWRFCQVGAGLTIVLSNELLQLKPLTKSYTDEILTQTYNNNKKPAKDTTKWYASAKKLPERIIWNR